MTLEHLPLVLGALVALAGLGLLADALLPDRAVRVAERRRRARVERNRAGEGAIALGLLAVAASLAGRDAWRYGTLAMLVGVVLLAAGAALNGRYLRDALTTRGAARRGRSGDERRTDGRADPGRRADAHPLG